MSLNQQELFEKVPVPQAIMRLAVPSVIGQIILVIYNMADTYFVSLAGNDAMIAAVTVCLPAFMFLSAISNLFGIGGGAAYSRALGKKNQKRCDNICTHALYGCILVTELYGLGVWIFNDQFIDLLGGSDPRVHSAAVGYLMVTAAACGLFTSLGTLFSHLIRAEGRSDLASIGVILGGVLNIILDPLFMFVIFPKGNEVLGAAVATGLSNLCGCLYFVWLLRHKSSLRFRYTETAFIDGSAREMIIIGLPACLMTLFENISYGVLDGLMASYGISVQAGIGVAKKVNMLAHSIVRGLAQGVLPLIAYAKASKNYQRMKETIRLSALTAVTVSAILTAVYFIFSRNLIHLFIANGEESLEYGIVFLRILCIGCPFSAFAYTVISFFQAVNKAEKSFFLAVLRKGAVDIPLMYILGTRFAQYGVASATPAADMICCAVSALMMILWIRRLGKQKTQPVSSEEGAAYA